MGPATVKIPSNPGTGPVTRGYSMILGEPQTSSPFAPKYETLPLAGFKEYIPQYAVGMRRLPPMSVPIPAAEPSIARRAASPPELPPHV